MVALESARVDAWLWAVRQYKTRSLATAACRAGHVRVNGERVKAAQSVKVGDEVRVRNSGFERTFIVEGILVKRVGAEPASRAARETTPPPPPREGMAVSPLRDRGAGRPTKRERRDMEKLRGH